MYVEWLPACVRVQDKDALGVRDQHVDAMFFFFLFLLFSQVKKINAQAELN
jgi:hypothetical protein